jgi:hypothetical protein
VSVVDLLVAIFPWILAAIVVVWSVFTIAIIIHDIKCGCYDRPADHPAPLTPCGSKENEHEGSVEV